ncbi:MAG: His/Gly/Thr/Pro-type tRNA ligase C-terminal domain-containing protein, partial [Luteibaculum sp.]
VLSGLAELIGQPDKLVDFTVALDKLDKIGKEKVLEEMIQRGIQPEKLQKVDAIFSLPSDNKSRLETMKSLLKDSAIGLKGIEELEFIVNNALEAGIEKAEIALDFTLARGLDYYTGAIFEVAANQVEMGSICGGGRYADLTGVFGLKDLPGVGISFGADRIYDVMESLNLFPQDAEEHLKVLVCQLDEKHASKNFLLTQKLRKEGIPADMYPESAKLKKQMKYADANQIPFVILAGESEWESGALSLKNMRSGEQHSYTYNDLIKALK